MRTNTARKPTRFTHEGAPAKSINPEAELRRSLLSCLLWERTFYEDGEDIAARIDRLAGQVSPSVVSALAIEAREKHNLRHAPLWLARALARHGRGAIVGETIEAVIQRADELGEFLSLYWRDGKTPISAQVKKGLARAFGKFDAYQLAKYDRESAVRLRDVLFMVHAKPKDSAQEAMWRDLVNGTLPSPDTWEVALSTGGDKREEFERLLREGKLGYMAVLRNLRKMTETGVDETLIRSAILARKGAHRVLPFRYVAAARAVPSLEPVIDEALCEAIAEMPRFDGKTIVLVDVSGSMDMAMSGKSDMTRMVAGAALASVIHGDLRVFTFSQELVEVAPRRGMAGVDAVLCSQDHWATYLGAAVSQINRLPHDRLIVVTDEQSHDRVPDPVAPLAYMVNIAPYENGVGYGKWTHIDGFSESVLKFIGEYERARTD